VHLDERALVSEPIEPDASRAGFTVDLDGKSFRHPRLIFLHFGRIGIATDRLDADGGSRAVRRADSSLKLEGGYTRDTPS
jgi:hypothetical protein